MRICWILSSRPDRGAVRAAYASEAGRLGADRAFIRREFPLHQRDIAQEIAGTLAEFVGLEIKRLRVDNTLKTIAQWQYDFLSISEKDLVAMFYVEYGVACDADTEFRTIVEKIVEKQRESLNRVSDQRRSP